MQDQTIFELYTDDKKSKYSSNPLNILKSAKKFMKLLHLHFLAKLLTERQYLTNTLIFVRGKYL